MDHSESNHGGLTVHLTTNAKRLHVVVIVLGDVGRSPRMQYHALSLLQADHFVTLVGYEGEDVIPHLKEFGGASNQLSIVRFSVPSPKIFQKFAPIHLLWRTISLAIWLFWALVCRVRTDPSIDCLLVQNPPALPLLLVAYLFRTTRSILFRKRPAVVIDWHNLGFSMLSKSGIVRKFARFYEKVMAPLADGHMTVTKAMKAYLMKEMRLSNSSTNIKVLYDCPPAMFRPRSLWEQHEILSKLDKQLCAGCPQSWYASKNSQTQTLLTEHVSMDTSSQHLLSLDRPRQGRPALVTSSTSWTPDEDFELLLQALVKLEERIKSEASSLKVLMVVTGKGPLKSIFQEKMSHLSMEHVAVQTMWLEPGDYPKLLACADVGISLHTSTSGLDLPMKVLDLFGARTPVCAYYFKCLSELVQDKVNGRVFRNSDELAEQLWTLLQPLTQQQSPAACHSFGDLAKYSEALANARPGWSENWNAHAWPVIAKACKVVPTSTTANG